MRARQILAAAILAAAGTIAREAAAQLSGAQVVAGHAAIKTISPTKTVIIEFGGRAIIDWASFSIPAGSSVTVVQRSENAILLDRVTGGAPSLIAGSLVANGQLWLINPAGVTIAPTGSIAARGVLVSTADLANGAFMRGSYDFAIRGDDGATVVNEGAIAASGGAVLLAAPSVRNDGLVEAALGTIVLAGATSFTVDFAGDNLLSFAVTGPVAGAGALVTNTGTLAAPGGKILLTATAAKSVLDNVINTSGIIEATSAANVDGKIVLSASGGGVAVSGTLDASGAGAGESGGTIEIFGDSVTLASGARLDVSGDAGGGMALVGGDFHGAGPDPNAEATTIAAGAVIDADALSSGNGGAVAVWSDGTTVFDGTITARGGAFGGNGGTVETSGKAALTVTTGFVDTRAPAGAAGNWLLDPTDIIVASGGVSSLTGNLCAFADATCATIDPSAIENAASNVTLQATDDIAFSSPIFMTNSGVGITAEAGNSITEASGASITTNGGTIALFANSSAGGTASGSGSLTLVAGLSTAGGGLSGGAVTLSVSGGTGSITLEANVTTAGGTITIVGPTVLAPSISFNSISIDTTNGSAVPGAGIAFNGAIADGTPGTSFQVTAGTGSVTFGGAIGSNAAPIYGITASGAAISLGGDIDASGGGITLTGPITLATSLTIDNTINAPSGNFVNLIGTIDGTTPGGQSLTINSGAATLGDVVGGTVPLGALTLNGSFFNLDAAATSITTAGGAVSFSAQVFSNSGLTIDTNAAGHAAGAAVDFASALNTSGPTPLTVNAGTSGAVTFNGGNNAFGAVSLTGGSVVLGSFNTMGGAVTINGPAMLDSSNYVAIDTTNGGLAAGANIAFNGAVVPAPAAVGGQFDVTAGSGVVTFGGSVGTVALPVGGVQASGAAISLSGNIEASGGFVILTGPITLATSLRIDNTINAPSGNFVNLIGTIDGTTSGGQSLTINSGAATLDQAVGSHVPLGALTLNGSFFNLDAAATSITTAGGAVSFGAQIFSQSGLTIDTNAAGHAAGAAVDFAGPINTSGPTPLTVDAGTAGAVTFNGGNSAFGAVSLTGGSITLGSGFNTMSGAVTLNGPTVLTNPSYVAVDTTNEGGSSGANIQFNGAVGGGSSLDLASGAGIVELGTAAPLGGLDVDGAGVLLGGNITTASGTVNLQAPATLETNVLIDTTNHNTSLGAPIILSQVNTDGFTLTETDQATIVVPDTTPVALQTLASASAASAISATLANPNTAVALSIAPQPQQPPPAATDTATGSDTLASVSDLDVGNGLFSQIQGGSGTSSRDPITAVRPVVPAQQARPAQTADDALGGPGSNLYRAREVSGSSILVPGIDRAASSSGNRSLWYAELLRDPVFSSTLAQP